MHAFSYQLMKHWQKRFGNPLLKQGGGWRKKTRAIIKPFALHANAATLITSKPINDESLNCCKNVSKEPMRDVTSNKPGNKANDKKLINVDASDKYK